MCYSRLFGNCCYYLFNSKSSLNELLNQQQQQSTDELIDESLLLKESTIQKENIKSDLKKQLIVTTSESSSCSSKPLTTSSVVVNCYSKLIKSDNIKDKSKSKSESERSRKISSTLSNLIGDIFRSTGNQNNSNKMNHHDENCVCSCKLNGSLIKSNQSDCGSDSSWIKVEDKKSKGKRVTKIKINEDNTIIYGDNCGSKNRNRNGNGNGKNDEDEDEDEIDQCDSVSQFGNNQEDEQEEDGDEEGAERERERELNFSKCCPSSDQKFGMDSCEWRIVGKEMVDYIANYLDTIDKLRVTPNVEPGYLSPQLPTDAPLKGNSYPSILADMLTDAISCIGFSWAASPSCTELETIMLDWMGKAIGLPEKFLCFAENSKGGGVIEGSASECILVTLLAARYEAVKQAKKQEPYVKDTDILGKLIAYCSKEAHSSVEKAAMIGFVKLRILDTDDQFRMRPDLLERSIVEDKSQGLIPFWACITLGSTSCCSVDPIDSVGVVCQKYGIWLHVDAAYGGSSLICPEFQYLLKGVELASSFNMNPNKWMLINFDCSLLWVTDRFKLTQALVVDPLYLQHSYSDKAIDYRHWGIPLSRRFRSLKLWFVVRNYGIEGLQKYIRNHVRLAKKFENLMRQDERFEIMNQVIFGLVCFRLKGSDTLNKKLLSSINASGEMHMVPANLGNKYVIRFCVCSQHATEEDINSSYEIISQFSSNLLRIIESESEASHSHSRSHSHRHRQHSISHGTGGGGGGGVEKQKSLSKQESTLSSLSTSNSISSLKQLDENRINNSNNHNDHTNNLSKSTTVETINKSLGLIEDDENNNNNDSEEKDHSKDEDKNKDKNKDKDEAEEEEDDDYDDEDEEEEETKKDTEDEMNDEVIVFDRKINSSLKYRRSFFVRMVSDPKLYNPKIVKALSSSSDQNDDKDTGILSPI
ncbi:uncharacterized protein LOC128389905 isoform X2 [Panonychus citri]|uniref:uncharacterized protein LOC128389905 isoform X2 n=1 Tax=Panonychus citri TaxID=50023 RepID=UPI002306E32A|nr:uncharacterized protein LOC128389905 isoform X2 [Panonychus citri]